MPAVNTRTRARARALIPLGMSPVRRASASHQHSIRRPAAGRFVCSGMTVQICRASVTGRSLQADQPTLTAAGSPVITFRDSASVKLPWRLHTSQTDSSFRGWISHTTSFLIGQQGAATVWYKEIKSWANLILKFSFKTSNPVDYDIISLVWRPELIYTVSVSVCYTIIIHLHCLLIRIILIYAYKI